jgi:hypothetical protein
MFKVTRFPPGVCGAQAEREYVALNRRIAAHASFSDAQGADRSIPYDARDRRKGPARRAAAALSARAPDCRTRRAHAVKAAGLSWWVYETVMKRYEKPIEEEKLVNVPPSLDLTPYRDEKDFAVLEQLVKRKKSKSGKS